MESCLFLLGLLDVEQIDGCEVVLPDSLLAGEECGRVAGVDDSGRVPEVLVYWIANEHHPTAWLHRVDQTVNRVVHRRRDERKRCHFDAGPIDRGIQAVIVKRRAW